MAQCRVDVDAVKSTLELTNWEKPTKYVTKRARVRNLAVWTISLTDITA